MDGISIGSAVLSLTVQLISTTHNVLKFLREFQDSPEELRCTIEFLDQLGSILEDVRSLVEEQSSGVHPLCSIASISNALQFCGKEIGLVEQCVEKFKGVLGGASPLRKRWASFKHVLNKGDMERLQDHLKDAGSVINTALVTNMNRLV